MTARTQILNAICSNLAKPKLSEQEVLKQYKELGTYQLPNLKLSLLDEFEKQLTALSGLVTRVKSANHIVAVVQEHILQQGLTSDLLMSDLDELKGLSWPDSIKLKYGNAENQDKIALSLAYAGIAETGSIVLLSSPQTPTSHNFLVEDHLIVLKKSLIKLNLEAVWSDLDKQNLPRTINILTGPSRTGDVEQTIQIGAHGPLRFHVILLEDC